MADAAAGGLREETLLPGYFFYGEESYLAEEFIGNLRRALAAAAGGEARLTRFDLEETKWREIVDAARTAPFLFEPRRAIVVRFPQKKSAPERGPGRRGGGEGDEGRASRYLGPADQKILRDYFADPAPGTVLAVIRAGKFRRDDAAVRFFQSLPKSVLSVTEMKRLTEYRLMQRADERARALGKTLTEGARRRLYELLGQDLQLTMNEIDKLAVFVGDKKGIEEEDVDLATAGQRSFEGYELDDALAAADFAKGAAVLDDLLAEGERPEQVVGRLAGFFRSVLLAQTWFREKSRAKDEIFQTLFPRVSKSWGDLYRRKFGDFFGVVEGFTPAELNAILAKLRLADARLKTTDADPRTVLQAFLGEFVLARKKKTIISPEQS